MEVAVKESNTKNDHDHSSTGNGGESSKDDDMSSRSEHSEYIYVTKVLPSDKQFDEMKPKYAAKKSAKKMIQEESDRYYAPNPNEKYKVHNDRGQKGFKIVVWKIIFL